MGILFTTEPEQDFFEKKNEPSQVFPFFQSVCVFDV